MVSYFLQTRSDLIRMIAVLLDWIVARGFLQSAVVVRVASPSSYHNIDNLIKTVPPSSEDMKKNVVKVIGQRA